VSRLIALALGIVLAAGPTPAADAPQPRPADPSARLSDEARAELQVMLKHVVGKARPAFAQAAMTLEQARHYAGVSPKLTWQGEFGEWFVFGVPDRNGGPDPWGGVVFVQKGSNLVGYFRKTW
jgi:hypothetical protein